MTVGRSIGSLLVCATLIPFYFQANQNQANHSFIQLIKSKRTKPNQTKPNQNDLRGLNEGMIDLNLIWFQLSNLCEDELFYSIQSNPVQFNSIKSNSIQIQYITNLNQIQSVWYHNDDY